MTPRISKMAVDELLSDFLSFVDQRMEAVRAIDVPKINRHVLKISAVGDALSATTAGRAELERLLSHPIVYVQVAAAAAMMKWAPEKAIPLFGVLLDADLTAISSPDERLDIRTTAKHLAPRAF